jgi:hypothetical protein
MAKAKKSKAELQAELSQKAISADPLSEPVATPKAKKEKAPKAVKEPKAPKKPKAPKPKKEKVEVVAEVKEPKKKGPGKIQQILTYFKAGMPTSEIAKQFFLDADGNKVATGFFTATGEVIYETLHPTTISIQVNKYKRANPDIYPPVPPAKTKKELAAERKAAKEAEAQSPAQCPVPDVVEPEA